MTRNQRVLILVFVAVAIAGLCKCATWYWRVSAENRCAVALEALQNGWKYEERIIYRTEVLRNEKVDYGKYDPRRYYESIMDEIVRLKNAVYESASRPYRRMDHAMTNARERLPLYVGSLVELQIARIVDGFLFWIGFVLLVVKMTLWAAGRFIANWIENGELSSRSSATCERLPNGDIVVHMMPK